MVKISVCLWEGREEKRDETGKSDRKELNFLMVIQFFQFYSNNSSSKAFLIVFVHFEWIIDECLLLMILANVLSLFLTYNKYDENALNLSI